MIAEAVVANEEEEEEEEEAEEEEGVVVAERAGAGKCRRAMATRVVLRHGCAPCAILTTRLGWWSAYSAEKRLLLH